MVMDLRFFDRHDPRPSEPWAKVVTRVTRRRFARVGLEVRIHGRERLGREPVLIACNATHQYDLVAIRYAFRNSGHDVVTLSKGKNYHGLAMRTFCVKLGSVPLVSRGYIIVMDFAAVHGRRPDEVEYRAIRRHLDGHAALPDGPVFEVLATRPRTILGRPFSPSIEDYRGALAGLYAEMMGRTLELCRRVMAAGHDVQIFPQGSSSTRLSEGRIGAVQVAHALGVPLLPIGVSGCLTVFPRHRSLTMAPGLVDMRVGDPLRLALDVPDRFRPFDPEHEREFVAPLRAATDQLMEGINALLDPEYQWAPDRRSDGAAGVRRFA